MLALSSAGSQQVSSVLRRLGQILQNSHHPHHRRPAAADPTQRISFGARKKKMMKVKEVFSHFRML